MISKTARNMLDSLRWSVRLGCVCLLFGIRILATHNPAIMAYNRMAVSSPQAPSSMLGNLICAVLWCVRFVGSTKWRTLRIIQYYSAVYRIYNYFTTATLSIPPFVRCGLMIRWASIMMASLSPTNPDVTGTAPRSGDGILLTGLSLAVILTSNAWLGNDFRFWFVSQTWQLHAPAIH